MNTLAEIEREAMNLTDADRAALAREFHQEFERVIAEIAENPGRFHPISGTQL